MMVYIGVDLHRKRSQVAAVDQAGQLLLSRRIATDPRQFVRLFGELAPQPVEVAFEATFGWGWFADLLAEAGIPAHLAHPLRTKAISAARVKNDAVDAKTLADLLRGGLLPEAWIAPPEVRETRRLVRMRAGLGRIRSRLKCQIHALLGEQGILPQRTDLLGAGGRRQLADLALPPISQARLEANLRLIDQISAEMKRAEQDLHALLGDDPRVHRLLPIPGIGFITAATVVAEIWDVSRFPSPAHLASWVGLTPSESSSAEHIRRGSISKQGSRWLRWVLVEAACRADRDPTLRAFLVRIARRRGIKIARVALAHRLLTLCFHALRNETGCRAYPLPASNGHGALVRSHGLSR